MIGFLLEIVTFRLHRHLAISLGTTLATMMEVAAVIATVAMVTLGWRNDAVAHGAAAFAVVILIFAQQSGAVSKLLVFRPFEFLDNISYSIYMVHLLIVFSTHNALELAQRITHDSNLVTTVDDRKFAGATPLMGDLLSLAVLEMAIVAATLTYKFLESPANQWVRRKVSPRKPD